MKCRSLMMAIVSILVTSGCTSIGSSVEQGSEDIGGRMNMQEAADRADSILDATFADIKPAVEWVHGESTEGSCDVSRRRAVLTVISERQRGAFLGVVERAWKKAGYRHLGVNASAGSPATYFETEDGFRVRLLIGGGGQAFFEVATPCVGKSQVAPPSSASGNPSSAGGHIPRPNIRSPFWSAGAP